MSPLPGEIVLVQGAGVCHHAGMGPLGTSVGCVPAEVVGEFVLNLCESQTKKLWLRMHEESDESRGVFADERR